MFLASDSAVSISLRGFWLLWMIGMLLATATSLAVILSPKDFKTDTLGPINMMLFSSHFCANCAFSDKKP